MSSTNPTSVNANANTGAAVKPNLRWTIADITATAVIAVASGVIFWAFGLVSEPITAPLEALVPGLGALTWGMFYFAGPLASIIVRKPGAAIFAELVAALMENVFGSHWGGVGTILPGIVQGVAAEIAFLIFAYKLWNVWTATLSGALAGLGGMAISWILYYVGSGAAFIVISFIASVVSGAVVSGALMWALYKAIAATGALDKLAGGRGSKVVA